MGHRLSERAGPNPEAPGGARRKRSGVFHYFARGGLRGIYYSNDPEGNENALLDFLQDVTVINIDGEIARQFGRERGRLRGLGKMTSDFDLLIGISARQNNLTLLTNNRKHFENIGGLRVESL